MKKIVVAIALTTIALTACGGKATAATEKATNAPAAESTADNTQKAVVAETVAASKEDDASTVKEQLEFNPLKTLDGEICLLITNNSSSIIDELEVQINYKNGSGETIDMDTDGHDMVLPGSTVVSKMSAPEEYSDYEIVSDVQLGCHPSYKNHADKISITSNPGDDCVIIEITNNDDVSIDEIEYAMVYYKGDEVAHIDYPQDIYDVEAGKTVTEKASPFDVDYDSYEVYLNQAHTF